MSLALSTKTFEYAATGLPTVASRVDSIAAIFDDKSILYADPSDCRALAGKIAELCLDPDRRRAQVQHARQAISDISYSVMIERYLTLVKDLMSSERRD